MPSCVSHLPCSHPCTLWLRFAVLLCLGHCTLIECQSLRGFLVPLLASMGVCRPFNKTSLLTSSSPLCSSQVEPLLLGSRLRKAALAECMKHIHYEVGKLLEGHLAAL